MTPEVLGAWVGVAFGTEGVWLSVKSLAAMAGTCSNTGIDIKTIKKMAGILFMVSIIYG